MFNKLLDIQFPRLLSQACRDIGSPFYGCFDRNWWHYRIRDFASIMLQQGGYTAFELSTLKQFSDYEDELKELAWASAIFWNKRAGRRGAFEEYYPWEKGYPPLAFSTLAMVKLVLHGVVNAEDIYTGFKKAARQLQRRFEYQAGNQQVAGLAALAGIRKLLPELVNEESYLAQKEKTLALQDEEGWFTEYDGPDLGYLSVTLDCLWDLLDFTNDKDYMKAAEKGVDYLYQVLYWKSNGIGMHNSRNTDYIVPYGISRFLERKNSPYYEKSQYILNSLYANLDDRNHFFHAIDDRYWSHYIGHSVVRAQKVLKRVAFTGKPVPAARVPESFEFKRSGYVFKNIENDSYRLLVSTMKGGVFTLYKGSELIASDYGWVIDEGKRQHVNHWWSDKWSWEHKDNEIKISGNFFPHSEKTSTPFLHFALRLISYTFGSSLTLALRKVLIFKSKTSAYKLSRSITIEKDALVVVDKIEGREIAYRTTRAPRASKRHVASADSFHHEDLFDVTRSGLKEKIKLGKDVMLVESTFPYDKGKVSDSEDNK